jgi:chromosome segregation ATPase
MNKPLTLIILSLSLGGCATTACNDPGSGGFFGGVCGLASGNYERRVDEREKNLDTLKQLQHGESAEQARLHSEKSTLAVRLSTLQAQAEEIDSEANKLARQVNELQAHDKKSTNKKNQLAKRLDKLRTDLKNQRNAVAKPGVDEATLKRYEAEEKRLQRELNQLKRDLFVLE